MRWRTFMAQPKKPPSAEARRHSSALHALCPQPSAARFGVFKTKPPICRPGQNSPMRRIKSSIVPSALPP